MLERSWGSTQVDKLSQPYGLWQHHQHNRFDILQRGCLRPCRLWFKLCRKYPEHNTKTSGGDQRHTVPEMKLGGASEPHARASRQRATRTTHMSFHSPLEWLGRHPRRNRGCNRGCSRTWADKCLTSVVNNHDCRRIARNSRNARGQTSRVHALCRQVRPFSQHFIINRHADQEFVANSPKGWQALKVDVVSQVPAVANTTQGDFGVSSHQRDGKEGYICVKKRWRQKWDIILMVF